MFGRVAFLNSATRTGIIFGSDRMRYSFKLADWSETAPPERNQEVNFIVQDGRVTAVRPLSEDFIAAEPEQEIEAPLPKKPRAGSPKEPTQAIEAFRSQMEYGTADPTIEPAEREDIDPTLDSGEIFKDTLAANSGRPQISNLLFTQPDKRSSGLRMKLLLAGAAAAVLAALGLAMAHM